jgi:hypothetical protein
MSRPSHSATDSVSILAPSLSEICIQLVPWCSHSYQIYNLNSHPSSVLKPEVGDRCYRTTNRCLLSESGCGVPDTPVLVQTWMLDPFAPLWLWGIPFALLRIWKIPSEPLCGKYCILIPKAVEFDIKLQTFRRNLPNPPSMKLVKSKAIPLQTWTVLEGSRRLRLPDFKTIGTWRW